MPVHQPWLPGRELNHSSVLKQTSAPVRQEIPVGESLAGTDIYPEAAEARRLAWEKAKLRQQELLASVGSSAVRQAVSVPEQAACPEAEALRTPDTEFKTVSVVWSHPVNQPPRSRISA